MLSRKPLGVVAILGIMALLGTHTANAEIDLDADTKGAAIATYAKETLLSTGTTVEGEGDSKTYYVVQGPSGLLNVKGKVGIGEFNNTQFRGIIYLA